MSVILVNGLNSKSGGGKSIFTNYLQLLNKNSQKHKYIILTTEYDELFIYETENIHILNVNKALSIGIIAPFVYEIYLNKLLKKHSVDLVFNLGDLIINTKCPQVYLFDWSYAVYPEHDIWKWMDLKSKINRILKLYFFKKRITKVHTVIAQTKVTKTRLEDIYAKKNIYIVPNAVSLDNIDDTNHYGFNLPRSNNLLYLTHYYPHKNLEILIPLAELVKKRKLDFKFIVTIDATQHDKARAFLEQINKHHLTDIIINIGSVSMKDVPSLYQQCQGLIMPTLLESFSGTYVEALFHKIPIFTSNLDFARVVCGDAAYYFPPNNASTILKEIVDAYENKELMSEKINIGEKILDNFPTWNETYLEYQKIINSTLKESVSW